MKAPLTSPHALGLLARSPDGRVELQRMRGRAKTQMRFLSEQIAAQARFHAELEQMIGDLDRVLGRPPVMTRTASAPPDLFPATH